MANKEIEGLSPRHFRIVDLRIAGRGVGEIAEQLGMSRTMVSIIINSPTFKHEFALRRAVQEDMAAKKTVDEDDDVAQTLRDGAIKAARKLVDHVDAENEGVSVRSCAEILDRSGYEKKGDGGQAATVVAISIGVDEAKRLVETLDLDNA